MSARSTKSAPKKRSRRLRRKPGQPSAHSKLTNELQQRICNIVASGQSRERAASLCRINRATIRNWLLRAQDDPRGRYAEFAAALEEADDQAISMMVNKMLRDDDWQATWKILKNKRPEEFNERLHIKSEVSGVDGAPIPINNTHFVVEVHQTGAEEGDPIIESNGNGDHNRAIQT